MAIYTRSNYSVLDTKALDAKTYYNSLSEYNADPYKYNGQIAYIKDAVEYYIDEDSEANSIYATSDSLRLNLPGTNKCLDFFYVNSSVIHAPGINISDPSGSVNSNLFTLNFDPYSNATCYMLFASVSGAPSIYMYDIDQCHTNYSSCGIELYDMGDFSSSLDLHGLNIGSSNSTTSFGALIGTGLTPNINDCNSLIIGQYNNNTDSYLFSVGCGSDNSHRRNVLAVDPDGYTIIDDLTVNSMAVNGGIVANSIIELDYLNKNIGIYLEGTNASQTSSVLSGDFKLIYGTYITGFKLRLIQAYKSTAKLNIFLYTNKTTKTPTEYILQNYPIGNLSVGDVVIEDMLIIGSANTYIGLSITGADNTGKAKGLLQYCQSW